MAELADAAGSKSADLRVLGVRLPPGTMISSLNSLSFRVCSKCAQQAHGVQMSVVRNEAAAEFLPLTST